MELKQMLALFGVCAALLGAGAAAYLVATAPRSAPSAAEAEQRTSTGATTQREQAQPAAALPEPEASAPEPVLPPHLQAPASRASAQKDARGRPPPQRPPTPAVVGEDDIVEISAVAVLVATYYEKSSRCDEFVERAIHRECQRRGLKVEDFQARVDEISADPERAPSLQRRINARVGQLLASHVRVDLILPPDATAPAPAGAQPR